MFCVDVQVGSSGPDAGPDDMHKKYNYCVTCECQFVTPGMYPQISKGTRGGDAAVHRMQLCVMRHAAIACACARVSVLSCTFEQVVLCVR